MFPNYTSPFIQAGDIKSVQDKEWVFQNIKQYMYLRLEKMFKYKGLPDSVPPNIFNIMLMNGGFAILTDKAKEDKTIYAFQGGLGGDPDQYYRPTIATISNPYLNYSANLKIGEECVLIRNDAFLIGLDPLLSRYASLMAENIITMRTVDVLLRIIGLISAPDDKTKISAETYLEKLEKGELGIISENRFFEGIKMQSPPANNGSYLTQFIELHQYYKGSLFNELGLQANFNMKRESIGKGEASLSEDILMPLCESMLQTRRDDFEIFNEMYGYHVEIDFDSAWMNNQKEQYYEMESLKAESEDSSQLEEGGEANVRDDGAVSDSAGESEETENNGGDNGEDNSGEDNAGEENAGEDNSGEENAGEDNAGEENAGEDNSGEDNNQEEQEEKDQGEHDELSECDELSDCNPGNEVNIEINIETGGEDVDGKKGNSEDQESDPDT